jgi:hypothetical protein
MWKNRSLSFPTSIKPKPLSVSRLIVPSAIRPNPYKKCRCVVAQTHVFSLLCREKRIVSGRLHGGDGWRLSKTIGERVIETIGRDSIHNGVS